jgi:excisionase family DNA binding protein
VSADRDLAEAAVAADSHQPVPAKDPLRRGYEPTVIAPVVKKVEWLAPAAVVIAALIAVLGGFRTTVRAAEINAQALVQVAEINARAIERAAEINRTPPPASDPKFAERMATVQYLTVDEVAVILRVDRKTVLRLITSKQLRAVRLGGLVRIRADALPR